MGGYFEDVRLDALRRKGVQGDSMSWCGSKFASKRHKYKYTNKYKYTQKYKYTNKYKKNTITRKW